MATDKLMEQFKKLESLNNAEAVIGAMNILKEASMANAPVRTGFLRDSHEVVSKGSNSAELRVNAPYAAYVEFMGEGFLRPAIDSTQDEIDKYIGQQIEQSIKGV